VKLDLKKLIFSFKPEDTKNIKENSLSLLIEGLSNILKDKNTSSSLKLNIIKFAGDLIFEDIKSKKSSSSSSSPQSSNNSKIDDNSLIYLNILKPIIIISDKMQADYNEDSSVVFLVSGFFSTIINFYGKETIENIISKKPTHEPAISNKPIDLKESSEIYFIFIFIIMFSFTTSSCR
jgi:hypothetical protein